MRQKYDRQIEYDMMVVGAGLVGLTMVSLLIPLGLRIAVVAPDFAYEAKNLTLEALDGRMIAITPSTKALLESMGIWQELPSKTLGMWHRMRVWDLNKAEVVLENSPLLKSPMAYVAYPNLIRSVLWSQISQNSMVTWIRSTKIKRLEFQLDRVSVYLEQGEKIQARLLIGADGAESQVRTLSGITCTSKNYHQAALVTMIRHTIPHHATAFQIFLESGPLAFLPAPDPYCSVVIWSTQSEQAHVLHTVSEAHFCQQLTDASRGYMNQIQAVGARYLTPLYRHHADHYIKPRMALVGDAAHRPHPLAGQGANLGMADVAYLAQIIGKAKQSGRDIGALRGLRNYERIRRVSNSMMLDGIECIHGIFTRQNPLIQQFRRLGLMGIQSCARLKRAMIRYAAGE